MLFSSAMTFIMARDFVAFLTGHEMVNTVEAQINWLLQTAFMW